MLHLNLFKPIQIIFIHYGHLIKVIETPDKYAVLLKPQFSSPIGRLFKTFRGDYHYFSAKILYSFQWDFGIWVTFWCSLPWLVEIIFGNPTSMEKLGQIFLDHQKEVLQNT